MYIAYLDEFGHIGPYISKDDSKHNTHPVFGLGGVVLPVKNIRYFTTFFFQLKNNLLDFELKNSGVHPAKWEKKGSSLYTVTNVNKYRQLRTATNRLLNKIKELDGFVIYVGIKKENHIDSHDSKKLYHSVLKELLKRFDQEIGQRGKKGLLILDQQEKNVMRGEIVEKSAMSLYSAEEPRRNIIEPPIEAESHLYQTLQCADWICGLIGRLTRYEIEKTDKYEVFEKYFKDRIEKVSIRSSIRKKDK